MIVKPIPHGPETRDPGGEAASYAFAGFTLSPTRRELRYQGLRVDLGARALDLLIALSEGSGQPVSKEALTRAAWGKRAVETNNLSVQMAALRRALQDAAGLGTNDTPLIRTVPGRGYLLTALVERRASPLADPPASHQGEPLTLFIGRERELGALANLLDTERLICVVGMGGVGKTRLALRLSRVAAPAFPHGVIFVNLAGTVPRSGAVAEAVALAVGAGGAQGSAHGAATAGAAVVTALHTRRVLLVIDNAEHVTAEVRTLLQSVFAACPGVATLVTSRETLGLPGEKVFRLPPLAIPPATRLSAAEALGFEAVRLFADRAGLLLPDFVLDDAVAPEIAAICRRLDGIALAIEMAVPRLQVMTPAQLAARLHDRFRTLASARHDVLPRQRTLRTMFDWSWELLDAEERRLLQVLAVFPGGAMLDAVTAVMGGGRSEWDIVDPLTSLAEKSLVVMQATAQQEGQTRYHLLETTRQYALEQLAPPNFDDLQGRQAGYMAAVFERAEAEWPTLHGAVWSGRYGPDADNLRAALEWAFEAASPATTELGLRLVAASWPLWWELPGLPLRESRRWHQLAIARIGPDTPRAVQARLWLGHSWPDVQIGDVENFPAAERAVGLFRELGDQVGLGAALWRAASTKLRQELHTDAIPLLDEAERVLRQLPPTKWLGLCLERQGGVLSQAGDLPGSLARHDEAFAVAKAMGHGYGMMLSGGNRSEPLYRLGRRDEAIAQMRSLRSELPPGLREPLVSLMAPHLALAGASAEAYDAVREVVAGAPVTGLVVILARAMETLAALRAREGDGETAARLMGFVLRVYPLSRKRTGARLDLYQEIEAALSALPPARRASLVAEGAAWTEADAVAASARAGGFSIF
jgi:predicted ATPase/DNA-binding winged helix-turn-helix (wHTH) protein